MRRQPASSGLRALLYMDEVHGILPPHPANPPTKRPLLTLFKQGRAFGVGAWLATQNPVDLDYKALGNAGVKLVGRLITDRDRDRALEGLGLSVLGDGRDADEIVAGLGKRQFLLEDVRAKPRVRLFSSRWAMSYLRGPVTLVEMPALVGEGDASAASGKAPSSATSGGVAASAAPPVLQSALTARFGPVGGGLSWPWILIHDRLAVRRKSLGLDREITEWWKVPVDPEGRIDWSGAESLDAEPELQQAPPAGMRFPTAAPPELGAEIATLERDFVAWRARTGVDVLANTVLKLAAGDRESREDFIERCRVAADKADDATEERIRARFERRMKSLKKRLGRERDELERDRQNLASRKAEEKLGLVESLFSVLLGSRSMSSASRKAAAKIRGAAGKRRMRQTAEGSVTESIHEIERLEAELEDLAQEMEEEIERMIEETEEIAIKVDGVNIRPVQRDVAIDDVWLVWS